MQVGELFVKLGLNGVDETSKGLSKISNSLKDLFSMTIQTKLTIAGIAASLTGAAFSAGKTGRELSAFGTAFDLSTKEMQKFSWATRQFGVDNEEAVGYIQSLQDAIANARQGGGMAGIFTALGVGINEKSNAFSVAKELAERAKTLNVDYYRTNAAELMSPHMVAANIRMAKQGGLESMMNKTPAGVIRSDKQIEEQRKIAVAFENFSSNLKATMDKFIADNGPLIQSLISRIEMLLKTFLLWIGKVEKDSGFVGDIARGENLGTATVKAAGKGVLAYGDTLNQFVAEGAKAIWETLKSGAMEIEARNMKASVPINPNKGKNNWTEVQQGNTSTFIMNGVNIGDETSQSWKDETERVFRQINTGKK